MADLATFTRRIRARARGIEENIDALTRRVAVAVDQAVVVATPVDTGRARGNWQVGIGAPVTDETERLDPAGVETIATNNDKIASRKLGQDIFISNNVPYIGRLNEGSSSQAPENFVEQAVAAGASVVNRAKVIK